MHAGYNDLKGVTIESASITVTVSNITSLSLENDYGVLDPKKEFLPFGHRPARGSKFVVGYDEAFGKKLTSLTTTVTWKKAPEDFPEQYKDIRVPKLEQNDSTISVKFKKNIKANIIEIIIDLNDFEVFILNYIK